mmetsp:Transcript_1238/g.2715  ORF Transcript_1238/g.2715 Transcript_1238/m.2715 type:complete len:621 (+) Transcript_1238:269-2131(+)
MSIMTFGGFGGSGFGFTIGGGFFRGFGGPPGSASGTSSCGKEFDAYVKRTQEPFPYDPEMPASHDLDMWKGRKAKIYQSPASYRIATVQKWSQNNSGPYSSSTKWTIQLKFDDDGDGDNSGSKFVKGDVVQIVNKPKLHDGKDGVVVAVNNTSGKLKVQLNDDAMVFVSVLPENLKHESRRTGAHVYSVRRMNVAGGGVLDDHVTRPEPAGSLGPPTTEKKKVSLEWIDEASPPLPTDLFPNTVNVKCPTCRAVEPNDTAFDDTEVKLHVNPESCPICADDKLPSRTLRCGHVLCNDCFRQWRDRGNSKIPSAVTQPHRDPAKLQRDRDRAFQRLRSMLPHTFLNGTATRANSRTRQSNIQPLVDKAMEDFKTQVGQILSRLDELAHPCIHHAASIDGEQLSRDDSLMAYWGKLREVSVHIFCERSILEEFLNEIQSMAAVEILMKVTEERKDTIAAGMISLGLVDKDTKPLGEEDDDDDDKKKKKKKVKKTSTDTIDPEKWADGYVEHCFSQYCNRIGELYEDDGNSRSAIHWYERAVLHSRKARTLQNNSKECRAALSMLYNNLGVAQRRAGVLTDAMKAYDLAIELHPEDETARNNKERLSSELEEWTGSSGKITPS